MALRASWTSATGVLSTSGGATRVDKPRRLTSKRLPKATVRRAKESMILKEVNLTPTARNICPVSGGIYS